MPRTGTIGSMNTARHFETAGARRGVFKPAMALCLVLILLVGGLFSLPVEAAPKTLMQGFVVGTQVLEVDCIARPVKKKACAPMHIASEKTQIENVDAVVTTVLYF